MTDEEKIAQAMTFVGPIGEGLIAQLDGTPAGLRDAIWTGIIGGLIGIAITEANDPPRVADAISSATDRAERMSRMGQKIR